MPDGTASRCDVAEAGRGQAVIRRSPAGNEHEFRMPVLKAQPVCVLSIRPR